MALTLIGAAFVIATPADATSATVIGFDDQAAGTVVTSQYKAQGVEFGHASDFGVASPGRGDCGSPSVTAGTAATPAFSAPNYAQLATCSPPGGAAVFYAGTFGAFTNYPRGSLSVQVRLTSRFVNTAVTVNGYNASGTVVATGTGTATDSAWTRIDAVQSSGSPVPAQVSYFEITTSSASANTPPLAIDDFSFDQAGAPLSASGTQVNATAGAPFSGSVATITDGDATATASDYAATIDWGDGSSSNGTVSAGSPSGQFTVSGSHTWSAAGTYPVHVAITKVNGRSTAADTTANVSAAGGGGGGSGGGSSSPSAAVDVLTPNPRAGGLVSFTAARSTPGSGRIIAYDWGFDSDTTTTSTGTNPVANWMFKPGLHTVTLTVTNSGGQHSTSKLGFDVANTNVTAFIPDGGQGSCQSTLQVGDANLLADCIQTMSGGGYVIETKYLNLNGVVLAPKPGNALSVFKVLDFKNFLDSGTELTGPAVNFELLNTPIGDMVLGGQDLTANPINLVFNAFHPQTINLQRDAGPPAHVAGGGGSAGGVSGGGGAGGGGGNGFTIGKKQTLLMQLGIGKSCSAGSKDPACCPPTSGTTACATLPGGFPLTGQIQVWLTNNGEALLDVQVGLDLSSVNFEATGGLEIEADPVHGINLESLQFSIPQAGLASIFTVKDASFNYYFPSDPDPSKADTWQAKATIIFGPLDQPNLSGELDFKHGDFQKASLLFTAPAGVGVPIYPGIFLNQIGATIGVNPLTFGGQIGASIATQLELSLAFLYRDATDTQLGFFGGQGQLSFKGDNIATLAADVYSDGYTDAAIDIDLHFPFDSSDPVVSVKGHIGFWDEPSSGRWEADGSVALKLWVISAEVAGLINDQQVAGCADISGFGVQGHYDFSNGGIGGGFFAFSNCDDQLKQYKETPVTPHTGGFVNSARDLAGMQHLTAADTRGGGTVRLPGGTDGQELLIGSSSGAPVVTIYAPNHQVYTTPATPGQISTAGGVFISAIAPDGRHVIVFFRHPKGGLYNIQPAAGSAPITSVAAAQDVPPAKIAVRVRHLRGRRWALGYAIKNYVAGTRVQFVERGRDSVHVIATVAHPRGTISFTPQDAIGRSRTIFAYLLSSAGTPLRTMIVGHYVAPPAQRPGRVRTARLSRGGTSALLSWTAAAGAREYFVLVRGSDGRVVSAFTRRRSLLLAGVLPSTSLTATVTPLGGPNLLPGPRARARLAAASTGLIEALHCARSRCSAQLVAANLLVGTRQIQATLTRGGRAVAAGVAANGTPTQVALSVRGRLAPGRYGLVLRQGRRTIRRTIRLR